MSSYIWTQRITLKTLYCQWLRANNGAASQDRAGAVAVGSRVMGFYHQRSILSMSKFWEFIAILHKLDVYISRIVVLNLESRGERGKSLSYTVNGTLRCCYKTSPYFL